PLRTGPPDEHRRPPGADCGAPPQGAVMLAQAAGFAALAAISPAALVVMAVLMRSADPRRTMAACVAGAFAMALAMSLVLLLVIRAAGLNLARHHDPRYGLRLALGVAALGTAAVVIRRRPKPGKPGGGLLSRLIAAPSARTAFAAGVIAYAPGAMFIAA